MSYPRKKKEKKISPQREYLQKQREKEWWDAMKKEKERKSGDKTR